MQRKRHPTTATTSKQRKPETKEENQREEPKGKPHQISREEDQTSQPPTPKPTHKRGQSFAISYFRFLPPHNYYSLPIARGSGKTNKFVCKGRPPLHRFLLPLRSTGKDTETTEGINPNLRIYRPPKKKPIKAP